MTLVCYKLKNSSYEEYVRGVKYIFKKHPKLRESYDTPERYISYSYSGFVSDCRRGYWVYPLIMRVVDDSSLCNGTDMTERIKNAKVIGCNILGRM